MKILIAEDHPAWAQIVDSHVNRLGFETMVCASCSDVMRLLESYRPDILLTDALLLDGDMMVYVPRIRQRLPQLGIVVMTARTHHEKQIRGLIDGADHYLVKPMKLDMLTGVLTSLSRRIPSGPETHAPHDQVWHFDAFSGLLAKQGDSRHALRFTGRESSALTYLLQNRTFPVSHASLLRALGFGAVDFDQHRIDTLVYRLRKKLEGLEEQPFVIKNVYSEGFLLRVAEGVSLTWSGQRPLAVS